MSIIQQRDQTYVAPTYARFPVEIVSGKGSVAVDSEGKEYIDLGSGIGVTAFGYCDDEWIAAVTDQLGRVQHTSNLYYTEPCGKLAELLCERTGMKKVFFSNSGAEANECAIKAARKYAAETLGADRYTIITLEDSFHGRTVTTLAATGQAKFHALFQPLTAGFVHTPANDFPALKSLAETVRPAAVMMECVQGEGGVNALDRSFVREVAAFCRETGILLVVDEVQTGNGRTGKLYSYMNFDVMPDIVTTAKGLGGGLPIGAALLGEKVANTLGHGDHGSTFGGNPAVCAGACSILERIDTALLESVKQKSNLLKAIFADAEGIESVTGMGLMLGLKTTLPAAEVVKKCMDAGVLCLTAKDKVRLLPALNIPLDLLEKAGYIIKEAAKPEKI